MTAKPRRLASLLIVFLVFSAYFPALRGGFVWDDAENVSENPVMTAPGGLRRIWTFRGTPQYYPLTFTSFWVERRLWGAEPMGYHAVNMALHALNALLIWLLLARLGVAGAWLAGAIFAVHPVHVESVAWVTERKNVLSALFYLLALASYWRFEDGRGRKWYWGAFALFFCALLSKTAICTFPIALLLLRGPRGLKIGARALLDTVPFFLLAGAMGLVTMAVENYFVGAAGREFDFSALQRALLVSRALWFYLGKLAWPDNLTFLYERWNVDPSDPGQWLWVLGSLAAAAALWLRRERLGRPALAGLIFFAVTLAPALGFFRIFLQRYTLVADHFQYLASAGVIAVAAAALWGKAPGKPRIALAAGLLAALWAATWRQAGHYRSLDALWQDTLSKNKKAFLAYNNRGLSFAAEGDAEQAKRYYHEALKHYPGFAEAYNNLGVLLYTQGRWKEAALMYRQALRIDPSYAAPHLNLGAAFARQKKWNLAAACFKEALRLEPNSERAYNNLGLTAASQGRMEEAVRYYHAALAINPGNDEARRNLAAALSAGRDGAALAENSLGVAAARQDRWDDATVHFTQALHLKPDDAQAHNNLGAALLRRGEWELAAEHFRRALALDPRYAQARKNLESLERQRVSSPPKGP